MQWEIDVLTSQEEYSADLHACADVESDAELRCARITFYQSAFDDILTEMVIHELLHLHFVPFKNEKGSAAADCEEHAVYAISRCIAKLATEVGE